MDDSIIYSLAIYFFFHVWNRSDLLKRPRAWVYRYAPSWVTYAASCAFCVTFHFGLVLTLAQLLFKGSLILSPVILLVAPVFNLVLDLVVKWLTRINEPPVLGKGDWSTTWTVSCPPPKVESAVFVGTAGATVTAGQMCVGGCADTPFNPLDHEQMR